MRFLVCAVQMSEAERTKRCSLSKEENKKSQLLDNVIWHSIVVNAFVTCRRNKKQKNEKKNKNNNEIHFLPKNKPTTTTTTIG